MRKSLLTSFGCTLVACDPNNELHYVILPGNDRFPLNCAVASPSRNGIVETPLQTSVNVHRITASTSGNSLLVEGESATSEEIKVGVLPLPALGLVQRGRNKCTMRLLLARHFQRHPTHRLLCARWHPYSERHVVLLTSSNTLYVVNLNHPDEPEQTYQLRPTPYGLHCDPDEPSYQDVTPDGESFQSFDDYLHTSEDPAHAVVSFSFLGGLGWGCFTIIYTMQSGDIYALLPVVPFDCHLPRSLLCSLPTAVDELLSGSQAESLSTKLRDNWVQAVCGHVPSQLAAAPALIPTRKLGAVEGFVSAIGPLSQLDEHLVDANVVVGMEVIPLSPPVVALCFSNPTISCSVLVSTVLPHFLTTPEDPCCLYPYQPIVLTRNGPPTGMEIVDTFPTLHLDSLRIGRCFCAHPRAGLYSFTLPSQPPENVTDEVCKVVCWTDGPLDGPLLGVDVVQAPMHPPLLYVTHSDDKPFGLTSFPIDAIEAPPSLFTKAPRRPMSQPARPELRRALQLGTDVVSPAVVLPRPTHPVTQVGLFDTMVTGMQEARVQQLFDLCTANEEAAKATELAAQGNEARQERLRKRAKALKTQLSKEVKERLKRAGEASKTLQERYRNAVMALYRDESQLSEKEKEYNSGLKRQKDFFGRWYDEQRLSITERMEQLEMAQPTEGDVELQQDDLECLTESLKGTNAVIEATQKDLITLQEKCGGHAV
eukprot:NODE_592_length_2282_cov_72.936545_g562_i0.p1 GENE.NODE_592_length_2282_cov_72.936545_g562_i0~~NODE_592_length_2282_cov_72.936545_g562_i0.p1  ORF type:complete len:709 (-),score=117.69 NODE_592_length_2282_cov_72.936545_g562_i0:97-2223(-)